MLSKQAAARMLSCCPSWLATPLAAAGPVVALISLWVFFSVWPLTGWGQQNKRAEKNMRKPGNPRLNCGCSGGNPEAGR